jgi:hypothetical protein
MSPKLHQFAIPTEVLERGFWLYVWQVDLRDETAVYYVGRTGDSSSLKAQSPFSRVSAHLGPNKHANALRRHLDKNGIAFDDCERLELVTFGPLYAEADNSTDHNDRRDKTHALESKLCRAMVQNYKVLNTVECRKEADPEMWQSVQLAFARRLSCFSSNGIGIAARVLLFIQPRGRVPSRGQIAGPPAGRHGPQLGAGGQSGSNSVSFADN